MVHHIIVITKLREFIGRERLFIHIYFCSWTVYLIHICYKRWFQNILNNFELVMKFEMFGQTRVD
jgi:hypothetical protein